MQRFYNKTLYAAFLLPALIMFTVFLIAPAFVLFPISMQNNNSIINLGWVGWDNYVKVFQNKDYWYSQLNILKMLIAHYLVFPIGWKLAFTASRATGWVDKIFRFAALFPAILAVTTVAKFWQSVFNANFGLLNEFLAMIGLESWQRSWLSSKDSIIWCIFIANFLNGIGPGVIIKLAAIRGIPHNCIEAAMLDGCTPSQADWRIRLPLLRSIIQYELVSGTTNILCAYALVDLMTKYNRYASVPMVQIVNTSMGKMKFGLGSAMAVIFFIECVVISLIVSKLTDWEAIEY